MKRSIHDEPHRQNAKKSARRIDVELVKRIIILLHEEGSQRRTKIASRARIAYNKGQKYLDWLELMGLTRCQKNKDGVEYIYLTERGNDLYAKYAEFSN